MRNAQPSVAKNVSELWGTAVIYETFFYWFGVGSAVCLALVILPFVLAVPALITTLLGRGVLEIVLWWEERWMDYEEGDSNYETQQNKVEFYEQAEEEGRWEWYVNRKLSNTHRRLEMFTDWYLDGVDKYVWSHVPLVN